MFTKLIGAATLFTAGSLMAGGSATTVGATPVEAFGAEAAFTQAGECGAKDAKEAGKTTDKAKDGKAKDGSCGKGSCGSKDKKAKKDGSCGKDKKEHKEHKEGSCGKEKK